MFDTKLYLKISRSTQKKIDELIKIANLENLASMLTVALVIADSIIKEVIVNKSSIIIRRPDKTELEFNIKDMLVEKAKKPHLFLVE